jgi:hypothetical protein
MDFLCAASPSFYVCHFTQASGQPLASKYFPLFVPYLQPICLQCISTAQIQIHLISWSTQSGPYYSSHQQCSNGPMMRLEDKVRLNLACIFVFTQQAPYHKAIKQPFPQALVAM